MQVGSQHDSQIDSNDSACCSVHLDFAFVDTPTCWRPAMFVLPQDLLKAMKSGFRRPGAGGLGALGDEVGAGWVGGWVVGEGWYVIMHPCGWFVPLMRVCPQVYQMLLQSGSCGLLAVLHYIT
jgi:hypothetical protein